ncbi:MAG: transposase [Verrucomicrobiota bacterium]
MLPTRKWLPHDTPLWITDSSIFFITICSLPRGKNTLCHGDTPQKLIDSARFYHTTERWYLKLFLLMPDHLHALIIFPPDTRFKNVIKMWKSYQTKRLNISWQKGFFDHRLRNDESEDEKAEYIRNTPVRANLVSRPNDWPHLWTPSHDR